MSDDKSLFLGLDAGTSGLRGLCIDRAGDTVAEARTSFDDDAEARTPESWKAAAFAVVRELARQAELARVAGLAVAGQSGTVLLCDEAGSILSPPMFYNQAAGAPAIGRLAPCLLGTQQEAPATLGRVAELWAAAKPASCRAVHQADWIAGLICGRFDFSDQNNALKLGYDPSSDGWAFDADALPAGFAALPKVFPPATPVARVSKAAVRDFGFSPDCRVITGTTDGMAGFIAASGLDHLRPGAAVTSLGTTLVIKSVSPVRLDVPEFGIYSHKLFDNWVAGGASNSGGGALLRHFSPSEIAALSAEIDPDVPSGLDYYPLVSTGERFPLADPGIEDHTTPRPDDPAAFLAGLFEGIARVEKRGFDLLAARGVPYPSRVITVGGGSRNQVWLEIRQRVLGAEVVAAGQTEAAYGVALIARRGSPAP